jgi:hypothetical protein
VSILEPRSADWHPDHRKIELAREGLLGARENADILDHLSRCAACQEGVQAFEDVFHESREQLVSAGVQWDGFAAKLETVSRTIPERSFQLSWKGWGAVAASAVLATVILIDFGQAPQVSAKELLVRATQREASSRGARKHRIQIRSRKRTLVREAMGGVAALPIASGAGEEEFAVLFARSSFDWNEPLSANRFRAWHDLLSKKDDTVSSTESTWSITTKTPVGDLHSGTLVVRKSDYHAIGETLEFSGERFDITELPDGAGDEPTKAPEHVAATAPTLASRPETSTAAGDLGHIDLNHDEIEIRIALHRLRADTEEQLSVIRRENAIQIEGVVDTASRLGEIAEGLRSIPSAELDVKSADSVEPVLGAPTIGAAATAPVHPPILQRWLEDTFPDPKQRERFTRTTLLLSREASKQVEALRVLAKRYPEAEWNRLAPADAGKLGEVIDDLRQSFHAKSTQLAEQVEAIAGVRVPADGDRHAEAWRCAARTGSEGMRHANHALLLLFTSTSGAVGDDGSVVGELRAALQSFNQTFCAD